MSWKVGLYLSFSFTILFLIGTSNLFAQKGDFIPTIKPQIWGHIQYSNMDDESTILIKRARFGAKGDIYKDIKYAVLFEAANSPYLLQAWIDYNLFSVMNFRIGQFKYPFGIESYHSATTWKFINPSFVTNGISKKLGVTGGSFRDVGVQANGNLNLDRNFNLNYAIMLMNGNGINKSDDNKEKDIALRTSIKVYDLFDVGVSYFNGKYEETGFGAFDENSLGVHLHSVTKLMNKDLRVQGEFITSKYEDHLTSYKPWGYYLYSTYNIVDKFEAGIRYDYFEKDKNAAIINSISRVTLSLGYYFTVKQRINLNYELIDDSALSENTNLFAVQFQYAIQ